MEALTALDHKLLANHYGRLGDECSDAGDAAGAAAAYTQEAYHLGQRQALGGHLGGRQPSPELLAGYMLRLKF